MPIKIAGKKKIKTLYGKNLNQSLSKLKRLIIS